MKKQLILNLLLTSVVSAEIPNFETFKEKLNNKLEAVKKVFPYKKTVKDKNDHNILRFKVVIPPEGVQLTAGFLLGITITTYSILGQDLIPDNYQKISAALLCLLDVASIGSLWHPKCKTGPYFAAGATTAATIAAVMILLRMANNK